MLKMFFAASILATTSLSAAAAGPAPPGSTFGAVVASDGTLLLGNASSAQKNQDLEGTYYVFFPYDVRECAITASVTGTGSTPVEPPAIITVANAFNTPQAVAIQMRDVSATLVPRGFHVILRCFR